uniref:NADH-ubiquinone oxidoreductase chain 4 n=1 Tax=Staurostoma mertensii TaxID=1804149 RepID=A0A0S2IAF9_9CNID|nr:NADH dehydrogenase subunit 4 [Staurostoma mertensii]
MYIIILLILTFIALLHIIITPRIKSDELKKVSLAWSLIILVYYNYILLFFERKDQFQFTIWLDWIERSSNLNWGNLFISIDGISLFFIGLSIILVPICIIMSWNAINHFRKEFLLSLFFILILLIGVFSVLDILAFYILFEAILIPMFLIIGVWGSREEKVKAAFYFFFYTLIGSLLMLLSIFKLYSLTGTTSYFGLIMIDIPSHLQWWLFLGFFASLAVKIPMIPVHIWLPQAHVEAPVAGSVLLAGILLKLGGYGFLRFGYPLFPLAAEHFSPFIILMSLVAIVYGSFTTCRQTDIKRLIAYSSVAHMGLVTLAIFTHSNEGLIASMTMMIAHGLVSSALFMSSAVLYVRHHSRAIRYFRGIVSTMPIFSSISLILILANIGFPLTFNFIAEFFSILAAFNYSYLVGILSCIGALLATIYALYFYNRIYFGSLSSHLKYSREMLEFEFQGFLPLVLLTIILGVFPNLVFNFILASSYINISL